MEELTETAVTKMKAIITYPDGSKGLALTEIAVPKPAVNQALIKVDSFSLNPGETRTAMAATNRYIPGWDFAGVIEQAAADGSSPKEGARVFGVVPQGSWAQYIVARGGLMAQIPQGVSNAQAAALPVAAVTAQACLETAGSLLGRKILITGAAGGLGRYACQLAGIAGAHVYAISRRLELPHLLKLDGVKLVRIFTSMTEAKTAGKYDLIVETIGGESLATALTALADGGVCASCGNSSGQPTVFDARDFYLMKTNTRLQSVWLGQDIMLANCTSKLSRLINLVKDGRLKTPIDAILPWSDFKEAAARLLDGRVNGKIILSVE
jgi:NADPH2:quinone reductase